MKENKKSFVVIFVWGPSLFHGLKISLLHGHKMLEFFVIKLQLLGTSKLAFILNFFT